jgi:hypothetical protein
MENSQWIVVGIGAAAVIIGIILAILGARSRKKLETIKATPTVSAADVARMAKAVSKARVEVNGNVEADNPLLSPRSNRPCVYYRYKLEQRIERRERDSQGNYRTEQHWDTVDDREEHIPFRIRDGSGACLVVPEGAEFVAETKMHEGYGRPHETDRSTGGVVGDIIGGVLDSLDGDYENISGYRITESVIPVGQPVYVLGTTTQGASGAAIGRGEGPFIISHKMEEELSKKYKWNYVLQYIFAGLLATGGIAAIIYGTAFMAK